MLLFLDLLLLIIYSKVIEKSLATILLMSAISTSLIGTWLYETQREVGFSIGIVVSAVIVVMVAVFSRGE